MITSQIIGLIIIIMSIRKKNAWGMKQKLLREKKQKEKKKLEL